VLYIELLQLTSTPPAAPSKWPVAPLVDETLSLVGAAIEMILIIILLISSLIYIHLNSSGGYQQVSGGALG